MSSDFVSPRDRRRLEEFVEVYRHSPYALDVAGVTLALPPSPIDEGMAKEHEDLLGATLPPLFRAYLLASCLPDTDLYVGQLPPIRHDRPFEWVERWSIEIMERPFYRRNRRLIPFSHGVADMSVMCFDIYRPNATGDYPIVDVWYNQEPSVRVEWSDLACVRSQVYSSFSAYLDLLQEWLAYRTAAPGFGFETWLSSRGKQVPLKYHGESR